LSQDSLSLCSEYTAMLYYIKPPEKFSANYRSRVALRLAFKVTELDDLRKWEVWHLLAETAIAMGTGKLLRSRRLANWSQSS